MVQKSKIEFANFICKFGDKNLLDFAAEIVLPAFTDDTLVRSYGKNTHYYFLDTDVIDLGTSTDPKKPEIALVGRFVKDTVLTREQVIEDRKLVKDEQTLRTSPSAFFVLVLHNHRLIYQPETSHFPPLSAFKITVQNFLKKKQIQYIDKVYEQNRSSDTPITKAALRLQSPIPDVQIISISSKASLRDFISRYEVIKSIDLKIVETNDEGDAEQMIRAVRGTKDELGADKAKVNLSATEGLDKNATYKEISQITATANQEIVFKGLDSDGNRLTGDETDFKVQIEVDELPNSKVARAESLYEKLTTLAANKTITLPQLPDDLWQKIRKIVDIFEL